METFRILIVENDEKFCHAILAALSDMVAVQKIGRIEAEVADSYQLATEYVRERFYHLAFVDPHLGPDDDADDFSGFDVIKQLAQQRPRSRRLLMTKHLRKAEYITRACELFQPLERMVDGIIIKQDWHIAVEGVVGAAAASFFQCKVDVKGVDGLHRELSGKGIRPARAYDARFGDPKVAEGEVDDVVSRLFGQGSFGHVNTTSDDLATVYLAPLPGGFSSAAVRCAKPTLSDGRQGVWCVVKVGPIDECREERARFDRFVRYRIRREDRVELLGYVEGDLLAGLCISFVGASPEDPPESLAVLFEQRDQRAIRFLESLFAPSRKDWYNDARGSMAIAEYFDREYHWKGIPSILELVDDAAGDVVKDGYARRHGDTLFWGDEHIVLPSMVTGDGVFRERQRTCIVHGDLHGGNVLVDGAKNGEGRAILIDYRHVGAGPRCIDFAALELSVRLKCNVRTAPGCSGAYVVAERAILRDVWGYVAKGTCGATGEYWETLSAAISRLAIANFEDLKLEEYAATCIMWGLRVISIPGLAQVKKLRVLEWLSAYCGVFLHG